jgi:hypothetical protein
MCLKSEKERELEVEGGKREKERNDCGSTNIGFVWSDVHRPFRCRTEAECF